MTFPDKARLLARLTARVREELSRSRQSQKGAHEDAIHEEARQEDPKDTRAIEAQYVARGLAERAESLQDDLAALGRVPLRRFGDDDPAALGALVGLRDDDGRESIYFLVPVAGGETLRDGDWTVQTLTPTSPLGRALLDHYTDEAIELELPRGRRSAVVAWIV